MQHLSVMIQNDNRRASCKLLKTIQELAEITLNLQTKFPDANIHCQSLSRIIDELGGVVKQLLGLQLQEGKGLFDATVDEIGFKPVNQQPIDSDR